MTPEQKALVTIGESLQGILIIMQQILQVAQSVAEEEERTESLLAGLEARKQAADQLEYLFVLNPQRDIGK